MRSLFRETTTTLGQQSHGALVAINTFLKYVQFIVEWNCNLINLGAHAHGIVTKTVHKTV